jgi:hypothetical protein
VGFNLAQYATQHTSAQPNQIIEDSAMHTAAVDSVEFVTIMPVHLHFQPHSSRSEMDAWLHSLKGNSSCKLRMKTSL